MDAQSAVTMRPDDRAPWWEAQAWALSAEADRRRRRQGTALIFVSAVFVVVSVLSLFVQSLVLIGLVGVVFFGGCLLAGVLMRGDPDSPTTLVLSLCVSLIMGLGCALLFAFTLMAALTYEVSGNRLAGLVVAVLGFVFFGIGGIVALIWGRRRRRTQLQNERRHPQAGRS